MDGRAQKLATTSLTRLYAGSTVKKVWGPKIVDCGDDDDEMDEKLWASLPQALVEEVFARLPIKLLFQCRVLSKAWKWNGGRPTRKRQQPSHFFEKAIASVSSKWPTYCPVYLFQDGLVGYNSESQAWEKIFDLKMFPWIPEGIDTTTVTSCAGSLVSFASENFLSTVDVKFDSAEESWSYKPLEDEIYVVNVVTKKWARLPPRPTMQRPNVMHLTAEGATDYKLILLTQVEPTEGSCVTSTIVTQIYRSSNKTWTEKTSKTLLPKWRTSLSNYAYLDGVFYIATGSSSPIDPPLLITHNVEKGTWNTMVPPLPIQLRQLVKYHVLICGSELILVARMHNQGGSEEGPDAVKYRDMFVRAHNFLIFKLDLATGQMKEVSRCPREKLVGVTIDQVLANGDSIYFGGTYIRKTPMMMYNVRKNEWTYHTSAWEMPKSKMTMRSGYYLPEQYYWTLSALQPGLNPFAEV